MRATFWLGIREVKLAIRNPAFFLPALLMPVVFYFIIVGSLETFAAGAGLENYAAFQIPVVILFAVTGGSAGLNMVVDIESGYFDKLLLTPASRVSLLIGAMAADFVRIFLQGLFVVIVALATGADFVTGIPGAIVMVAIASLWGLAYSAIGFSIALKTGSPQATMNTWVLQVPLVFLSTMFAPLEALTGWLKTVATYNPVTYLIGANPSRGLRSLAMTGWDLGEIGIAILTAVGFGVVTISIALAALRGRVK